MQTVERKAQTDVASESTRNKTDSLPINDSSRVLEVRTNTPRQTINASSQKKESNFKENLTSNSLWPNSNNSTPFSTPSHGVVQRIKGKRVRLDSGAQVQEIEPYHQYYHLSEEATNGQFKSESSPQKPNLELVGFNKNTKGTTESPVSPVISQISSPDSVGDDSSIDYQPNPQAGLMTNSMVNLASVGLNQGPQTTPVSDSESFSKMNSGRSSCASLPDLELEAELLIQKGVLLLSEDENNSVSIPGKKCHDLTSSFTSSCSQDSQTNAVTNINSQNFKSNSAPDVRALVNDDDTLVFSDSDEYHDR